MKKTKPQILIARTLSVVMILFFTLFSLDAFGGDVSIWFQIGGFLIHMLPTFVIILATLLSWRNPKLGGFAFLLLSALSVVFFRSYRNIYTFVLVSGLPMTIGAILLLGQNKRSR
jgi:hypothetical protein